METDRLGNLPGCESFIFCLRGTIGSLEFILNLFSLSLIALLLRKAVRPSKLFAFETIADLFACELDIWHLAFKFTDISLKLSLVVLLGDIFLFVVGVSQLEIS